MRLVLRSQETLNVVQKLTCRATTMESILPTVEVGAIIGRLLTSSFPFHKLFNFHHFWPSLFTTCHFFPFFNLLRQLTNQLLQLTHSSRLALS